MKKKRLEVAEDLELPRLSRLLLKLPTVDFFGWLARRGFFVALLIYSLALFGVWLLVASPIVIMVFAYPLVGFPLNIIVGLFPLAIILIFWARLEIERTYNYLKSLQPQKPQRKIEEIIQEYTKILASNHEEKK